MVYVVVNLEGVCFWSVTFVRHVVIADPHIPSSSVFITTQYWMIDTTDHDNLNGTDMSLAGLLGSPETQCAAVRIHLLIVGLMNIHCNDNFGALLLTHLI